MAHTALPDEWVSWGPRITRRASGSSGTSPGDAGTGCTREKSLRLACLARSRLTISARTTSSSC